MPIQIRIALSGTHVRPENDPPHTLNNRTTKVPRGESLTFTVPTGFSGVSITFDGASPFGALPEDGVIQYGSSRPIPASAPSGVFPYTCVIAGPDGVEHSSGGGGEIEIG